VVRLIDAERGWVPVVTIDPELIRAVDKAEQVRTDIDDLRRSHEELETQNSEQFVGQARALLGLKETDKSSEAWKAYERLSAAEPERERELNSAFWAIDRAARGIIQFEINKAAELIEEADQLEMFASTVGWPAVWPKRYARVWHELGGTRESADAWAVAGFDVRDVLLAPRLVATWNATPTERVVTVDVPPFTKGGFVPLGFNHVKGTSS
jgi:hypothetical protein